MCNDKSSKFDIAKIGDCLDDLRLSVDQLKQDFFSPKNKTETEKSWLNLDFLIKNDYLDDLRLSVVQLKQDFCLVEKLFPPATVFTSNILGGIKQARKISK